MTRGTPAWLVDQRWLKAYPLGEDTTIGRGARSTIILRDPAVSRTHAKVKRVGDGYLLIVVGASGTKINGLNADPESILHEGDVVEISFTSLQFTMRAPTVEMLVLPRDTPTPIDSQEGPTRATLRAVKRTEIFGDPVPAVRRLWHWLTRRTKTD